MSLLLHSINKNVAQKFIVIKVYSPVQIIPDTGLIYLKRPKKPGVKKTNYALAYYIKNADLVKEVVLSKSLGALTPRAIEMFIKLATESNKKLKYKNPMDREDCVSSAIEDLLRYWKGFDPAKSNNAFAYFSQMAKNGFAKGYKKLHHPDAGPMISISHDGIYNI